MILVTGSTGFVGSSLVSHLVGTIKVPVRATYRVEKLKPMKGLESVMIKGVTKTTNWQSALTGIDVVVHAAARVHVMNETSADPLSLFRDVNVEGTLNLAMQAVEAGVKRFIFISTIKVNGERTKVNKPYQSGGVPMPEDPYGVSKCEAEVGLRDISQKTGLEVVIIRPPLVYGPGVKANFAALMNVISKGFPLPFGSITNNKRSMVYIGNLVDFIALCIAHPKATNKTFLIADTESLSTYGLVKRLSLNLRRSCRIFPLPVAAIKIVGNILGKSNAIERLTGSLEVDMLETTSLLNWIPPFSVDQGLEITAKSFLKKRINK